MWVMTISSPGPMLRRPKLCATRLMPSVELRVKTISRLAAAFRNRCTLARAASYAAVASSLSTYTPRWMLALPCA